MPQFDHNEFNRQLRVGVTGDRNALLQLLLDVQNELGRFVADRHGTALQSQISDDDILQETFVRAFRDVKSLRADNRIGFVVWLETIAANQIRDTARRQSAAKRGGNRIQERATRERFAERAVELIEELVDVDGGTPSHFAARNEAMDALTVALANLSDEQREAVRLHFFERLTLIETAARMDRSWDSVRGLIQRAKQSLRASMHKSSLWFSKKA